MFDWCEKYKINKIEVFFFKKELDKLNNQV